MQRLGWRRRRQGVVGGVDRPAGPDLQLLAEGRAQVDPPVEVLARDEHVVGIEGEDLGGVACAGVGIDEPGVVGVPVDREEAVGGADGEPEREGGLQGEGAPGAQAPQQASGSGEPIAPACAGVLGGRGVGRAGGVGEHAVGIEGAVPIDGCSVGPGRHDVRLQIEPDVSAAGGEPDDVSSAGAEADRGPEQIDGEPPGGAQRAGPVGEVLLSTEQGPAGPEQPPGAGGGDVDGSGTRVAVVVEEALVDPDGGRVPEAPLGLGAAGSGAKPGAVAQVQVQGPTVGDDLLDVGEGEHVDVCASAPPQPVWIRAHGPLRPPQVGAGPEVEHGGLSGVQASSPEVSSGVAHSG